MRGPSLKKSQLPLWLLLPLLACMGCSGDDPITRVGPEWITELEYRFTGTAEQGVLFNRVHTSVDPNRNRILVLDHQESHVSAWKPDGSLVFVVGGKGEGPGEFAQPSRIYMAEAGGPPGALDLLELNADGDTLWKRRLQFEPLKLTPEWVEEVMDIVKAPDFPLFGFSRAEQLEYLKAFEETLYKPEYLPPAQSFFVSAADEVWIRTFERSDTLRVYYTIPRDDMSTAPRRVLLPESFSPHDATATHVWGTRDDLLGVPYVVGRKLKRAGAS